MIALLQEGLKMYHSLGQMEDFILVCGGPDDPLFLASIVALREIATLRGIYHEADMPNHERKVLDTYNQLREAIRLHVKSTAEEVH